MEINAGSFTARYSMECHNFTSLFNTESGDEYVKRPPRFPLLSLIAWREGKKAELWPEDGSQSQTENGIRVTYRSFGGCAVQAVLDVAVRDGRLYLSADVKNESDCDVIEVLMPRLNGIVLGETHTDDVILYPHHAGERSQNPVQRYKMMAEGEWGRHWRAASMPVEDYYRREINYCGLASMSWMYYHDAENGLYVGSHDGRFPMTGIIAESSGDEANPWMGFAFRKHRRIRPGECWNTGEYCLAVSCRDWHYGAELYREYILPLLEIQPNAAFLQDEAALHKCYNLKHSGTITRRFADLPAVYDKGAQWGVRHMFVASWNRTGFDSSYPEYYPDMELGSAMEFRRGMEYIKENGGFTTLYVNARIFDITSDFHSTVGQDMAIRTPQGETIQEVYGPAHFTVNCPSDKLWQDYLIDTAEFAAMAYGCQGIYLDQLASAEPYACYSEQHSHENIGEFNQGYLYIMRELLTRLRARDPEAYLMVENCGDLYGAWCWSSLTWNGNLYDEYYNLFKYTFPEFAQVNMVDPRGWVSDPGEVRRWFYSDMERAVLLGSILWMGITDKLEGGPPEYREYAHQALSFRQKLQPYIKQAAYLDDAWVQKISEDCAASCWQLADGRILLIAGNQTLRPDASVCFALPGEIEEVECRAMDWAAVQPNVNGSSLTLPLGGNRLFCAVVSCRTGG